MTDELDRTIARQHGTLTRRQARASGLHRSVVHRRLRRGIWIATNDEVLRVASAPRTERQQVMEVVLSGGPGAVATASTALALRGIRGGRLLPAVVVTGRRPPRWALPGVSESFRLPESHCTELDGIPTATVARALFDLAARVRPERLARAVDAALAARAVTVPALDAVLRDLAEHGRNGSAALRLVLEDSRRRGRAGPSTGLEAEFLGLVRAAGLTEPACQVDVGGRLAWIGRVDFLWRAAQVIVEVDGGPYHDSVTDRADDEVRDRALEAAGWTVLRFSDLDVSARPTSVVRTLSRALAVAA